jgi:hypothetical protein
VAALTALPKATVCLSAMAELMGKGPWLTGSAISVADLYPAPMFAVSRLAPERAHFLNRERRLADGGIASCRTSFERTQVPPRHLRMAAKCSPMRPSFASPEWKSDEVSLRVMTVFLKKPYAIPAPINTMSTDEPVLDLHHLDKVHLFATRPRARIFPH